VGNGRSRDRHFCRNVHIAGDRASGRCRRRTAGPAMTAPKPGARPLPEVTPASNENQRLATLLQISQALSSTLTLKTALHDVLETLAREHSIERSLIALKADDGPQLHIEAAHGLSRPAHHVAYTIGEGIIGKVVESGKAAIVPRASRE